MKPNLDRIIEIESSMISAAKYNSKDSTLEVWFNSGAQWRYLEVPENVFNELLESGSKGSFMRSQIIGEYDEERLGKNSRRR